MQCLKRHIVIINAIKNNDRQDNKVTGSRYLVRFPLVILQNLIVLAL